MSQAQKKYIAFFDLDKTIIDINSGKQLVKQAYKDKLMGPGDLVNAIIQGYLYRFSLRDTHLIIASMGNWLKGIPEATVQKLCSEVSGYLITNNIRPEIISEIEFHKSRGGEIIILSSAINPICEPIGKKIGADNIICSAMETIDGILTGKPVGKFCFEEEKRARLIDWCETHSVDLKESWYYADSTADLPALEAVGNPVCVSPDRKLSKIANERGWRIIDSKA